MAQIGSLEKILRQAKAHANTVLGSLADHLATVTQSLKNETAAAAELASSRPGTDAEGRCKAFRDAFGSAHFTFTVDSSANRSVSTNQSVQAGESNPNLGRRLHEQKGIHKGDTKREGAGTGQTTKKMFLLRCILYEIAYRLYGEEKGTIKGCLRC